MDLCLLHHHLRKLLDCHPRRHLKHRFRDYLVGEHRSGWYLRGCHKNCDCDFLNSKNEFVHFPSVLEQLLYHPSYPGRYL